MPAERARRHEPRPCLCHHPLPQGLADGEEKRHPFKKKNSLASERASVLLWRIGGASILRHGRLPSFFSATLYLASPVLMGAGSPVRD